MTTIYILYYHHGEGYDYEEYVIGVFDSEEKAKEAMKDANVILDDVFYPALDDMGFRINAMKLNVLNKEFV